MNYASFYHFDGNGKLLLASSFSAPSNVFMHFVEYGKVEVVVVGAKKKAFKA